LLVKRRIILIAMSLTFIISSTGCLGQKPGTNQSDAPGQAVTQPSAAEPQAGKTENAQGTALQESTGQTSAPRASTSQSSPGQPASAQPGTANTGAAKPSTTAPGNTTGGSPKNVDPIDLLETMNYNSSEMVFDIIKLNWNKAQERLTAVKSGWREVKPLLEASSVPASVRDEVEKTVDDLEAAVFAGKVQESKELANKITRYIPDIEDLYGLSYPTDINRLGYLSREIHINVNESDWTSAKNNYEKAKNTWGNLETKLDKIYKADADKVNSVMGAIGKAVEEKNAGLTVTNSNALLGYISAVKLDFKRQGKN
jgi:predicted translin family RNA/ssDNA-binding protein